MPGQSICNDLTTNNAKGNCLHCWHVVRQCASDMLTWHGYCYTSIHLCFHCLSVQTHKAVTLCIFCIIQLHHLQIGNGLRSPSLWINVTFIWQLSPFSDRHGSKHCSVSMYVMAAPASCLHLPYMTCRSKYMIIDWTRSKRVFSANYS